MRTRVSSGSPYEPRVGISRAVRAGSIVTVAGTAPLGPDGRTVGRGDPTAQARRCLEICEANGIGDFDLAYAYEAMARALLTAGERAEAAPWIERARAAGDAIAEADDREIFAQDLVGLTA